MTAIQIPDSAAGDTLRGIGLMTLAMAGFAAEDVFIKFATASLPVWQVLVMLGAGGGTIFWLWSAARGRQVLGPDLLSAPVLLRNAAEVFGTICFVSALALIPLSSASAILQATPLGVTLGAALFLGAQVGWRRWSAIVAGFAGVLLILRPGLDSFQPASLLAVGGVIGLSVRDLATRVVPMRIASEVLSAQSFVAVALAGLVMAPFGAPPVLPSPDVLGLLAGAIVFGVGGYYMITAAMRMGDITLITPFRYSRLLFALILAVTVFGERPDAATLAGAAIIVGSGLYTFLRERRQRAVPLSSAGVPR